MHIDLVMAGERYAREPVGWVQPPPTKEFAIQAQLDPFPLVPRIPRGRLDAHAVAGNRDPALLRYLRAGL